MMRMRKLMMLLPLVALVVVAAVLQILQLILVLPLHHGRRVAEAEAEMTMMMRTGPTGSERLALLLLLLVGTTNAHRTA
jgi:hypothetical protein